MLINLMIFHKIMKNSIFSRNEWNYLKDKKKFKEQHSKNHVYQIRHSIRKKISNFISNDLELFLSFDIQENKNKNLMLDKKMEFLAIQVLKHYPFFILKILKLPEVKNYLGN